MKHLDKSINHGNNPIIPLMLADRFKRLTGEKLLYQPLAAETNNDRRLDIWFARLLSLSKTSGIVQGWLFPNNNGKGMVITEMDVLFYGLLKEMQRQNPSVISDDLNIEDVYSNYQYLWWGATLEA